LCKPARDLPEACLAAAALPIAALLSQMSGKLAAQPARFFEQAECTVIRNTSSLILGTRQQQTKNDVSKILALPKNAASFFDFVSVADIEQRSG